MAKSDHYFHTSVLPYFQNFVKRKQIHMKIMIAAGREDRWRQLSYWPTRPNGHRWSLVLMVVSVRPSVRTYVRQVRTCVQNKLMTDYAVGSLNSLDLYNFFFIKTSHRSCKLHCNKNDVEREQKRTDDTFRAEMSFFSHLPWSPVFWPTRPRPNRWSLFLHVLLSRRTYIRPSVRPSKKQNNAKTLKTKHATTLHGAWWVTLKSPELFGFFKEGKIQGTLN